MYLRSINNVFILGHTANSIYIFDLINSKIVLWKDNFGPLHSVKVINSDSFDTVMVFTENRKAYTFQLKLLEDILYEAINKEQYSLGAHILVNNLDYFKTKFRDSHLFHYSSIFKQNLSGQSCDHDELIKYFTENLKISNITSVVSENTLEPSEICEQCFRIFSGKIAKKSEKFHSSILNNEEQSDLHKQLIGYVKKVQFSKTEQESNQTLLKMLSEEEKTLQDLYVIYKSSNISKLDLKDRYVHIFGFYDSQGIRSLLNAFDIMIRKYDINISLYKAKQICSHLYLNYISNQLIQECPYENSFLIECFIIANSSITDGNTYQRCDFCNFPTIILEPKLKYYHIGYMIVEKLFKMKNIEKLMDIISFVPTVLNILLMYLISEFKSKHESDNNLVLDIMFSCVSQYEVELSFETCEILRTNDLWKPFLSRIIMFQKENKIKCVRCKMICQTKTANQDIFSFKYNIFKNCANILPGYTALELCVGTKKNIPSETIDKIFFMQCLLNS